jgi:hypothetical protein
MLVMSAPLAALTFSPAPPKAPQPPRGPHPAPLAPLVATVPTAPRAPDAPIAPANSVMAPTPLEPMATPRVPRAPLAPRAPTAPLDVAIASTVTNAVSTALVAAADATRSLGQAERALRGRRNDLREASIALRAVGVTPQYAAAIRAAGPQFRALDHDELIELRVKGVTPEFIAAVAAAGYGRESIDAIGDAAALGLTPGLLRDYARVGPRRSLEDVAELRILGITPEYLSAAQRAGGPPLTNEQLFKMRLGVPQRKHFRTP